jgi:DNA modification methylase
VLDAFLGSGTTLMAAERTGRVCHGMEIDPLYVDTLIRRWQAFTGQQAVHLGTGLTFPEVQAERTPAPGTEVGHV